MTTLIKWSVDDYHQMIAAGILQNRRVELLAGDIVEVSPEGPVHASRIRKVSNYLRSLLSGLALVSEAHPITLQQPHNRIRGLDSTRANSSCLLQ
ncbi:MAG: hypothetical protein ACTS2F_29615 [Thainema sp.]